VEIYHLEDLLDATDHEIDENSYYNRNGWRKSEAMEQVWITTKGGERRCEFVDVDYQTETSQISGYYAGYKTSTQRSMERVSEQNLNYDLLEDTLLLLSSADNQVLLTPSKKSLSSGAFLIFLPGIAEIKAMMDRLENHRVFSDRKKFDLIPLHSSLSSQHQRRAFAASRSGCRKVLLATNIAETSVTIPDVVCVIDCGLVREIRYDKRYATTKLVLDWCSKASIKQRSGRAGRVQEGICCRLYSSRTANHVMKDHSTPELQRMALEDVCISILAGKLSRNCSDFLMQAPQPPPADAISLAIRILHEVGILSFANNQEILTPLGLHVAKIPVDFRLAKMLIFAALFKCLDPILSIVGSLSAKSPFAQTLTNNVEAQAAHRKFQHNTSDFIALVNVWNGFIVAFHESKDRGRGFCRKNFINWSVMMEVYESKRQNLDLLCKIGFMQGDLRSLKDLERSEYNVNGKDENVIHAIIFSGLYPNVAQVCKSGIQDLPFLWHKKEQLHFHPSSINCKKKVLTSNWIVFHEKFSTNRTSVSVTCPIHPKTIILFGGSIVVKYLERKVFVDEWIELDIAAHTGVMLRKLRYELDRSLSSSIQSIDTRSCHDMAEKIVKLLQEG
jgi:ATP-dependent RNA helicase DHX29